MTNPIVEAGAKALYALENIDMSDWDEATEDERDDYAELAQAAILVALRQARDPEIIGRLTPWELAPYIQSPIILALIQGYIDAVIREIEA